MKLSTTIRLRAYLVTASLSAVAIQIGVLASIFVFGVPESWFQTVHFRLAAAGAIGMMVLISAAISHAAFRSAVARHYAIHDETRPGAFRVSDECPLRAFVILHLRMTGVSATAGTPQ
ncbi:hypothetical protein LFL96_34245 [Paraburkholderia sp. D15]|uniref:hypothetical protein n=1 Tax=Paraburkholderia sp. D15 TaxID=2880218 RepID=UPI00247984CC|nr:hypothetical protein [Paraburkholderia sp. D15]WGS53227.1 hypothetical protein LFL96_34245 [Paraburkholderia sp. D15]